MSIRKSYFFVAERGKTPVFTGELMVITGGCFGGANGERGFVNYFDTVFKGLGRLYILKGGCGCGKSSLMRAIAAEAERRGETVEPVYCASDPDSLDGVILRQRGVGVLDGTAPHERAPRYTGVVDSIVDLGEYLNTKKLRERSTEIIELTDKKKACYKRAYGLLAAAGGIRTQISQLTDDAVLWEKMEGAAKRIAAKQAAGEMHIRLRPRKAFCGKGLVSAEGYGASEIYAVNDPYDIAHHFYRALFAACVDRGASITISPDAQSPHRIEAVRMDESGVLFCGDGVETASNVVNMERFVDKEQIRRTRHQRRFLEKARKGLTEAARDALAEARSLHGKLEGIYIPAMSFARVDKRTAALIKEIFA